MAANMTTSAPSKTMFNYFTKLPSKTCIVEETNPRKLAPMFNKQHVEEFLKNKVEQFDAEITLIVEKQQQHQDQHQHQQQNQQSNEVNSNIATITSINYVTSIKTGQHKPFRLRRKVRGPLRARLIQYHEDVRPPYYGTWQAKSKLITGRRPFTRDDDTFDYDVDSEAEWDIGGPGESLKGDDSDDEEELDDYEIDMKTFVPHGYVSDDEIEVHSDQEENQSSSANQGSAPNCDENSNLSVQIVGEKGVPAKVDNGNQQQQQQQQPQTQKQKDHYQQNNANSPTQCQPLKQQTKQEIKPISLGLYYENEPAILSESKIQFLKAFQGFSCT